jgi:hypothetical protein
MTAIVIDEKTEAGKSLINIAKSLQKATKAVYISIEDEDNQIIKSHEKRKPSDFVGTLSKKESEDLLESLR